MRRQHWASNGEEPGGRRGEALLPVWVLGGAPHPLRPHGPIHSLGSPPRRGCVPAAGRLSLHGVSTTSRAEVVLLFLGTAGAGPMCPLLRGGLGGTSERGLWAMTLSNSFLFGSQAQAAGRRAEWAGGGWWWWWWTQGWRASRRRRRRRRRRGDGRTRRVARVMGGGRSGLWPEDGLALLAARRPSRSLLAARRRLAPSRAPARSEQSQ